MRGRWLSSARGWLHLICEFGLGRDACEYTGALQTELAMISNIPVVEYKEVYSSLIMPYELLLESVKGPLPA